MKMTINRLLPGILALAILAGCSTAGQSASSNQVTEKTVKAAFPNSVTVSEAKISDEAVALSANPALASDLQPVASDTLTQRNGKAVIDYSNTKDGYVMVKYTASTSRKLKAQVIGPSGVTYTYNITAGADWTTFPLSDGNGSYKVAVYENISGNRYSTVISVSFNVSLTDEFAPFVHPNQYVNYSAAPETVAKAASLTSGTSDTLNKVKSIYTFVVTTLSYDKQKAATVQSGYLPSLDETLATRKGICFDYAALMAGMLRSQGVPCKLVIGYAGTVYHAWISVYAGEKGWISGAIYFDGSSWKLMDPTFASSAKQSAAIMQYIGDGSHYTAKYLY